MQLVIFDLDGTLIDSKLDLAHSVNSMLSYLGRPPISHELINSYVGNGAPVLVRRALGPEASEAEAAQALDFFIRYYAQHCLDNTSLYPGVQNALDRLRDAGLRLAILTNKPVRISNQIVRNLGVGDHFFRVYGGNSFDQKKPNPVGIETLMQETNSSREQTMMVGDSAVDVLTARNAQVGACGVTYGFQPETLQAEPPDLLVDNLEQFADFALRRSVVYRRTSPSTAPLSPLPFDPPDPAEL
ncbi:MAG: HAD-IA family hydrolase [Acidobacteriaceae bacterium]|nr:HAD-IA family hydrolase [Acidobacteriaceae bacterium]